VHEYGVSPEIVRMTLALGVVVSVLVCEYWRLTGGGVVVAGYLGLFVDRPLFILTTVSLAVVTFYLVQYVVARRMFLYGRRRLVVMVVVGMGLQFITGTIAFLTAQDISWLVGLYGVGFVLPGLIAQDMERQSVGKTLLSVLGTSLLTFLLFQDILAIKNNLPIFWNSIAFIDKTVLYAFHTRLLIPAAVIVSVGVSALLFEWYNIRSGGFLTAGYTALFLLQPLHLVFIVVAGILVYFIGKHFLMGYTPVFGRTKFAMMVLTGLVLTWGLEILAGQLTHSVFIPLAGFSVISPMIAALIANDGEKQGLPKTLLGITVTTIIVFIPIKAIDLLILG
jgi:poly-gamma-glutamate biosynthesis protein PgsC/CapC